jgi:membrane protease subunit HflC
LLLISDSIYVVKEYQQAVILRFGKFITAVQEPGLHFKMPIVQQVSVYDKRLLEYDVAPTEIVTKDKRTLLIDSFSKWRITDPEIFYKRVRNEFTARGRIKDVIFSDLAQEFGQHTLEEIVSINRREFMENVTKRSNSKVHEMGIGIEILDVRIKRADLPDENKNAVYRRMRAERKRIAAQFRSEGDEEANKIRAKADKEKVILLATAYETKQKLRGEGDAQSIKIYADAYETDPDFFAFTRSLEAYGKAFESGNSIILTDKSEFLKYFNSYQ